MMPPTNQQAFPTLWILLYDGVCPWCSWLVRQLPRLQIQAPLAIAPQQGETSYWLRQTRTTAQHVLLFQLHNALIQEHRLIQGTITQQLQGIPAIATLLTLSANPAFRILGKALHLPIIQNAASALYWIIARLRPQQHHHHAHCPLPPHLHQFTNPQEHPHLWLP